MGDKVHPDFVDEFSGEIEVAVDTELGREIEKLQATRKEQAESRASGGLLADTIEVPLDQLQVNQTLFQPRLLPQGKHHEDHVSDLKQAYLVHGTLDPIAVLPLSRDRFIVIDGHHRVEALKLINAERRTRQAEAPSVLITTVSARVWTGNVKGAVVYARAMNSKAVKPLTPAERSEAAWRMVLTRHFSNRETVNATGISLRTVKTMNAVLRTGGPKMATLSWAQARQMAMSNAELTEEEQEALLDSRADELFKRLWAAVGPTLQKAPELVARGILRNAPKTGEALAGHLMGHDPGLEDEE